MSDARRAATSVAAGFAGRAAVLGLGLVSVAITTRYLGASGYGRFAIALSLTQLFGVLADAGLTAVVVRELSQRPERAGAILGSALVLRSGLSVMAVGGAVLASFVLPYPPSVRLAVAIAGVPLVLGLLNSAWLAVLQADLRAGRAAIGDVAGRAASLAAVGVVIALDLGFHAVVAAAGVGAAVTLGVTRALVRSALPASRPRPDRETVRSLLVATLPIGLALALNEAYGRADALIISVSRSYGELGLYSLGWRLLELSAVAPAVLLFAIFPLVSRYVASGDGRLQGTLQAGSDVLALAGIGLATGGALVADELAVALGGPSFAAAAGPMRVLLIAAGLGFVSGLYGHALIAKDRRFTTLWLNVLALALNVGLNLALVPRYGILAAAWVAVATEVVILLASLWLVRRAFAFLPSPAFVLRGFLAAGLMAAVLWPVRDLGPWLTVPLGAAVYVAALVPLGARSRWRALRAASASGS